MSEFGGFVPVELREYVQGLMDERNGFEEQREDLEAKIRVIDEAIAAACEYP